MNVNITVVAMTYFRYQTAWVLWTSMTENLVFFSFLKVCKNKKGKFINKTIGIKVLKQLKTKKKFEKFIIKKKKSNNKV